MSADISIGPVPSRSAWAWIGTAQATIGAIRRHPEFGVPDDVASEFERYVREWTSVAAQGEEFYWEGTIEPALARRLAAYWLLLVTIARDRPPEETGIAPAPPEAQPFFEALAAAMAAASAVEDDEAFTARFEEAVPGFDERRPPDTSPGTRILIVDDNDDIRLLFRATLEFEPGLEICGEATNGAEALAVAGATCPDVVLLDVTMPVMDGLTALPHLREQCPGARVVVITAVPSAEIVMRARELGAAEVLHKSVSLDELKRAIAEAPAGEPGPAGTIADA